MGFQKTPIDLGGNSVGIKLEDKFKAEKNVDNVLKLLNITKKN